MTYPRSGALKGQVLVFCALALTVLLALAALAVDAAGAWWMGQAQDQALEASKERAMQLQNAIKFGQEADGATESSVRTALDIVSGSIESDLDALPGAEATISVVELPESEAGSADRYIGIEVSIDDTYETTFARAIGIREIPVHRSLIYIVHPYSSQVVWRESADGDRARRVLARGRDATTGAPTWSEGPVQTTFAESEGLASALADAAASGEGGA